MNSHLERATGTILFAVTFLALYFIASNPPYDDATMEAYIEEQMDMNSSVMNITVE